MKKETFLVVVPPQRLGELRGLNVVPGHLAYRVGQGPHLLRTGIPTAARGGLMVLDGQDWGGRGESGTFCQEVVRECQARGFTGVICDFEGEATAMKLALLRELERHVCRRGWAMYVPECYGEAIPNAHVMVPSALSGGSLELRLREVGERFGRGRVTLALQRAAEDFLLPAPRGSGTALTREELGRRMERLRPAVFFSRELCARYFTYMTQEGRPHFVLFDDADTLRQKLTVARQVGISTFLAAWPEVEDAVGALGLCREETQTTKSEGKREKA